MGVKFCEYLRVVKMKRMLSHFIHSPTATTIPQPIERALKTNILTIMIGSVYRYRCCGGTFYCVVADVSCSSLSFCLGLIIYLGLRPSRLFSPFSFLFFLLFSLLFFFSLFLLCADTNMKKMPPLVPNS